MLETIISKISDEDIKNYASKPSIRRKDSNNYFRKLQVNIVKSQFDKLEIYQAYIKKNFDLHIPKSVFIKIAIDEFFDKNQTSEELEAVLKKYSYI